MARHVRGRRRRCPRRGASPPRRPRLTRAARRAPAGSAARAARWCCWRTWGVRQPLRRTGGSSRQPRARRSSWRGWWRSVPAAATRRLPANPSATVPVSRLAQHAKSLSPATPSGPVPEATARDGFFGARTIESANALEQKRDFVRWVAKHGTVGFTWSGHWLFGYRVNAFQSFSATIMIMMLSVKEGFEYKDLFHASPGVGALRYEAWYACSSLVFPNLLFTV
mmetsp:Transcript_61901/g.191668  ORF Transcript_61901/g.191668 Transcript_61901/m.191668 type:complete len:224 (+) Transcript_61901:39-710(+)